MTTTDITTRLRGPHKVFVLSRNRMVPANHDALLHLMQEAADEIERLRTEAEGLRGMNRNKQRVIDRLETERHELRAEKQRLIDHEFGCSWDDPAADCEGESQCHRQFLKGEVERLESLVARYEAVLEDMPVDLEDMEAP